MKADEPSPVSVTVQPAAPGAICLTVGDRQEWLTPDAAVMLAGELKQAACRVTIANIHHDLPANAKGRRWWNPLAGKK